MLWNSITSKILCSSERQFEDITGILTELSEKRKNGEEWSKEKKKKLSVVGKTKQGKTTNKNCAGRTLYFRREWEVATLTVDHDV